MIKMTKRRIILGSRGSRLALWQANFVKKLLEEEYGDLSVTIKAVKTTGDKIKGVPLAQIGGKSLFIKEIEEQLLTGKIDIGVHSMKDVPTELPRGLMIGSILKREDPRDVFVSKKYDSLLHLSKRARVGTSSLRRQAQLKNFRPDLEVVNLRGNVETRLRKLGSGDYDAVILAASGLTRLGMVGKITEYLPTTLMLPAAGQGAIGLEVREEAGETRRMIEVLNDIETVHRLQAERTFLKRMEGDCRAPIAAYAEIDGQTLRVTGVVVSVDGRELVRDRMEGNIRDAVSLGEQLAKALFAQGAREILRSCREQFG